MTIRRRETSAETAARFLQMRLRKIAPVRSPLVPKRVRAAISKSERMTSASRAVRRAPKRIYVDFAEPTLRAIHEALLEQLIGCRCGHIGGDLLNRTLIAEQMVGAALGEPSAWPDQPPLTDREKP